MTMAIGGEKERVGVYEHFELENIVGHAWGHFGKKVGGFLGAEAGRHYGHDIGESLGHKAGHIGSVAMHAGHVLREHLPGHEPTLIERVHHMEDKTSHLFWDHIPGHHPPTMAERASNFMHE